MSASAETLSSGTTRKPVVDQFFNWCAYLSVGSYAIFAVLGFLGSEVIGIDESLQLLGGREVFEGRTPHRDFWSMYPPLNYYLNGLLFHVFRPSFMVARFLSALIYGATVIVMAAYVNRRLKQQSALLRWATLSLAVFCLTRTLGLSQNNTLFAAVLVLMYCIERIERERHLSSRTLLFSGLAGGLLLTMRLNLGIYVIATIGATAVVSGETLGPGGLQSQFRRLLTFLVAVLVPVTIFLLLYGRFAIDVIRQIAITPGLVLRAGHIIDASEGRAPYCAFLSIVGFALVCCRLEWTNPRERTIAVLVATVAMLAASLGLRALSTGHLLLVPYAIPGLLMAILVMTQIIWKRFPPRTFVGLCFLVASLQHYLIRADGLHLFILSGAVAITAATAVASQPTIPRVAIMAALFWLMMWFPLPIDHDGIAQWLWPVNPKSISPALRVISSGRSFLALGDSARIKDNEPLLKFERRFFPDADEISVARYVDRFVSQSDSVFMGLSSHDRTRVNDARLSWIMPRPLASRYLEFEPGVITSESVQREVVQSLRAGVRWAVLEDTPPTGTALYPFPKSSYLDEYIAATYKCVATFGKLRVCCRPAACPSSQIASR